MIRDEFAKARAAAREFGNRHPYLARFAANLPYNAVFGALVGVIAGPASGAVFAGTLVGLNNADAVGDGMLRARRAAEHRFPRLARAVRRTGLGRAPWLGITAVASGVFFASAVAIAVAGPVFAVAAVGLAAEGVALIAAVPAYAKYAARTHRRAENVRLVRRAAEALDAPAAAEAAQPDAAEVPSVAPRQMSATAPAVAVRRATPAVSAPAAKAVSGRPAQVLE